MRAATDFLRYRNSFLNVKSAGWEDMLSQAGNYIADNEWAQGAIGGGLLGGLTGLLPGQSIARNAMIGAGLGGVGGGLYQLSQRQSTPEDAPEVPRRSLGQAAQLPEASYINPALTQALAGKDRALAPYADAHPDEDPAFRTGGGNPLQQYLMPAGSINAEEGAPQELLRMLALQQEATKQDPAGKYDTL